jgi:hypothetical protein
MSNISRDEMTTEEKVRYLFGVPNEEDKILALKKVKDNRVLKELALMCESFGNDSYLKLVNKRIEEVANDTSSEGRK